MKTFAMTLTAAGMVLGSALPVLAQDTMIDAETLTSAPTGNWLAQYRGGICFCVDLDPRWVVKLIKKGWMEHLEAYKTHCIDQALTIFAHQHHALAQGRGAHIGFGRSLVDLRADFFGCHQQLKNAGAPGIAG